MISSSRFLADNEIGLLNNKRLGVNYDNVDNKYIAQVHTTLDTTSIVEPIQSSDKYMKWIGTRIKSRRKLCWIKGTDFNIKNTSKFPDPAFLKYKNMF